MKALFFIFTILSFFFVSSFAKSFVVCGEEGSGKSTLASSIFGVNAPIGIFFPQARDTTRYTATSRAVPAFQDSIIYDTPGTSDYGVAYEEVLSELEADYLREIGTNRAAILDGFILTISSGPRVRLRQQIESLVSSFSSSVIKSMVIVINWLDLVSWERSEEMRRYVELRAAEISGEVFGNEFVQIPVVVVNAKNPTDEQINDLILALSKVRKYHMKDVEKKRNEIEKIYEFLLPDSINREEKTVEAQEEFKKVPQAFASEIDSGCTFALRISGTLSICLPKRISENIALWIDEDMILMKKERLSIIEERISQALKKEREIYWKQAVDIFHKRNRINLTKRSNNYDL